MDVRQVAALDILIGRILEAVLWQLLEAGGLVERQAEGEDVGLRQELAVDAHREKLRGHVAAVALLRHRVTVDRGHMAEVANLVRHLARRTVAITGTVTAVSQDPGCLLRATRMMSGVGRFVAAEHDSGLVVVFCGRANIIRVVNFIDGGRGLGAGGARLRVVARVAATSWTRDWVIKGDKDVLRLQVQMDEHFRVDVPK